MHSGHRIGTAEVESALASHPQCAEAAVVGVEHEVCRLEYAYDTDKNLYVMLLHQPVSHRVYKQNSVRCLVCLVIGSSFIGLLKAWRVSWFLNTEQKVASLFLGLIWFFIQHCSSFTVVKIEVEITFGWLWFCIR